jgi:WD40 repeat protein
MIANRRGTIPSCLLLVALAMLAPSSSAQKPAIDFTTTFKGHTEPVYAVALTPDGKHLVTGSFDNSVRLWELATGKQVKAFDKPAGHTKMVLSVAVSPDGSLLATGGADGSLKLWDLPVDLALPRVSIPRVVQMIGGPPYAVAWNVAGEVVSTSGAGSGRQITAAGLKPLPHPANINIDSIAFHPRNRHLVATGSHDGRIRVYDLTKNALLKEIVAHADKTKANPIYTIAFSPDGGQVLSASFDHSLKLHDAVSGALVRDFKARDEKAFPKGHVYEVYAAAFSPDGALIASGSGGLECGVKIWKTADGSVVRDLINPALPSPIKVGGPAHPGWIYHVRFLKDGRLITVGDAPKNHGHLAIWNVADGKLLHAESTPFGSIYGFAMSRDEKTIVLGAGNRGRSDGGFNNAYLVRVPGINK